MTAPLRTAQQVIQDLGLSMTPGAFKRLARQLALPYHKIGKHPYYGQDAVDQLLKDTRICPDAAPARASHGDAAPLSSDGQRMAQRGSVQRARQAANALRQHSRPGSASAPGPQPVTLTRELLEILAEEAAEVIHRVQKAQRFGLDEIQPGQQLTNAERIAEECGDFVQVMHMLEHKEILPMGFRANAQVRKSGRLHTYLQNRED